MKCLAATLVAVLLSTGCAPVDLDPIMGRTDGTPVVETQRTPVVETQRLDCDLIFPGPSGLSAPGRGCCVLQHPVAHSCIPL